MPGRRISSILEAVSLFHEAVNGADDDNDFVPGEIDPSSRKNSMKFMERIAQTLFEAYADNLDGRELSLLIECACDAENKILEWAYGSEERGGFNNFPLYSGNVIKDISLEELFRSPGSSKWSFPFRSFMNLNPTSKSQRCSQLPAVEHPQGCTGSTCRKRFVCSRV